MSGKQRDQADAVEAALRGEALCRVCDKFFPPEKLTRLSGMFTVDDPLCQDCWSRALDLSMRMGGD